MVAPLGDKKRIDVAVAVVFNHRGEVLWGCRPEGKPYAGYWEFPGGKVEAGETVWQALVRELREELDIECLAGARWFIVEHDYEHAHVRLHLYRVWTHRGEPKSLEGQQFAWANLNDPNFSPILPATAPLLPVLAQPRLMALSDFHADFDACSQRLQQGLSAVAEPVYVQFREPGLRGGALVKAFEQARRVVEPFKHGTLLINSATRQALLAAAADGLLDAGTVAAYPVHLTEQHLLEMQAPPSSGLAVWGASAHSEASLSKAHALGLRYAVVGAVKETPSHPGQEGLGWTGFEAMTEPARLPVFAIGGLSRADLHEACAHGAHGIAMMRQFD
ncbi:Nudix family hydrolase [Limnobacter humi]|uniref:8-oxo-dGTP diphosphatase n=1 Tax=Limnobacter humi TaxID=1778671 RepID=A0ABT1WHQ7_9BURK|nr:Nudix family hydrolase [Limnobacter humi]MCQ8897060.1 Nudix family hydrolase [Limnobacter humi]